MKRNDDQSSSLPTDDRGVSEVVAVALLIGIVVTGVSVILLTGGDALDRNQKAVEVSQAEHALTQLDTKASRVALGDSPSQQVDLGIQGSDGTLDARSDSGWMRIERVNATTGKSEQITKTDLGAVVYEHSETTVAYQGGGVWRSDGDGSVMISRPEVHYRDGTLSVPIIRAERGSGVYNTVEITQAGPTNQKFPDGSAGWTNKVNDSMIVITVQSEYYEAWGRFFEKETNAFVSYDHTAETATIWFLAVPTEFSPRSGVIATAGPGNLELEGTDAYIDSYNSIDGPYAESATTNGSVEASGDVLITGDAEIAGDVSSGGYVAIDSNSGTIDGDVGWTEGLDNSGTITGTTEEIEGVAPVPPIDGYVTENVEDVRAENDNDKTTLIEENELSIDGSSGTLGSGDYYVENLDLEGEELVLDTTNGDITIAVRDWIKADRHGGTGGSLTVKGDGDVEIFVAGDDEVTVSPTGLGKQDVNLFIDKDSSVNVPNQRSNQLTIYAKQDFYASIAGSSGSRSAFEGVIYAPAGDDGPGYIYIKHADLYGAVVTGDLTLGQYGAVHFDHALRNEYLPLSPTISRLEYMYVTEHQIEVSSA